MGISDLEALDELEERADELERNNKHTIDRELKMVELKKDSGTRK